MSRGCACAVRRERQRPATALACRIAGCSSRTPAPRRPLQHRWRWHCDAHGIGRPLTLRPRSHRPRRRTAMGVPRGSPRSSAVHRPAQITPRPPGHPRPLRPQHRPHGPRRQDPPGRARPAARHQHQHRGSLGRPGRRLTGCLRRTGLAQGVIQHVLIQRVTNTGNYGDCLALFAGQDGGEGVFLILAGSALVQGFQPAAGLFSQRYRRGCQAAGQDQAAVDSFVVAAQEPGDVPGGGLAGVAVRRTAGSASMPRA